MSARYSCIERERSLYGEIDGGGRLFVDSPPPPSNRTTLQCTCRVRSVAFFPGTCSRKMCSSYATRRGYYVQFQASNHR